jgi:acylphosphatase
VPGARFLVRGRVQGVGFRWFVWKAAGRLGLRGVARNLPDGAVEVMVEGPDNALEELAQLLARGPSLAHVEHVERSEVPHDVRLPNSFEIK